MEETPAYCKAVLVQQIPFRIRRGRLYRMREIGEGALPIDSEPGKSTNPTGVNNYYDYPY